MKLIYAISTLSGTIIGVGIFALPYITLKAGFWVVLGYFVVLGFLVILIHLIFGELALKTPDYKRLPGFAKIYLGTFGEKIAYVSTILGSLGAILAYLIVGGEFLENLLSPVFGGSNFFWTTVYFLLGALLIFFGIKIVAKVEFFSLILFFFVLILLFFAGKGLISKENLFITNWELKLENFFLPYAPILFSLWGASLIPEIEEMLKDRKFMLKIVIFVSILIPILVYSAFVYLILGICGEKTTPSALVGLKSFLGEGITGLTLFLGTLTTFTSFITLGLTLKKIFWYDLQIGKNLSMILATLPPYVLFLCGVNQFLSVISIVGGIFLGVDGILILLMYRKIQRSSIKNLLLYPLFLILVSGILFQLLEIKWRF